MLMNFKKNPFTVGFCNPFVARSLLYFSPHFKHVATLACETSAVDTFDFQQTATLPDETL